MAIAFDTASFSSSDQASGVALSHAAGATARAAVVGIADTGSNTDRVSTVTYGGVAMTDIRNDGEGTEAGRVHLFWLDGIDGGTHDVVVTHTGTVRVAVATMTAADNHAVELDSSASGTSASVANPSWTHTANTTNSFGFLVIHSGLQTMTSTPAANWTLIGSADRGAIGWGAARGTNIFSTTTLAPGWTAATADDFVGDSAAFVESPVEVQPEWFRWPLQRGHR